MSSRRRNITYELPSSTTTSDDIRDIENDKKRFRRAPTPLDSSEAEAAPTADREGRSPPRSYSLSSTSPACAASSGNVSCQSNELDSCSWSIKYHESREEVNGDRNENTNKHPPHLESPPFRPASPFEVNMEDDSFDGPPNPSEHIQLSRAETDAIIDRLLSSCDGDFGEEFGDDFDPAIIKFEIVPEVREPRNGEPITLYSTEDEDESENEFDKNKQIVIIDDESDDEEVKIICQRQNVARHESVLSLKRASTSSLGKRSLQTDEEDENDVIFVPQSAVKTCADTTSRFGEAGTSARSFSGHVSRPSTSRAALNQTITSEKLSLVKTEPTHSTAYKNVILNPAHMTDYRIAFAEVEQILTEDNERNRLFFSAPSPPPPDRGMFKSKHFKRFKNQKTSNYYFNV